MQLEIEKKETLKTRKKLFWLFQLFYWSIYWLLSFFSYPLKWNNASEILDLSLTYLFGFVLSLLLKYIYDKYSVHKFNVPALIAVGFLFSLFSGLVFLFVSMYISFVISDIPMAIPAGRGMLLKYVIISTYPFIIWSTLYICYIIWNEWRIQQAKTEQEKLLSQKTQLEMLRYQLNPHFLYNTLSSLRALVRIDTQAAEQMITRISEFLRYSLSYEDKNEVTLCREIEIIKYYLDIEKVRFGDKICIAFNMDENSGEYSIPVFLIHPLVENAVKHGMQTSSMPLTINIASKVIGGELCIDVLNSGKWRENTSSSGEKGKGLENVKRRLELSYPGHSSFEIIKNPDNVIAKIRIGKNKE